MVTFRRTYYVKFVTGLFEYKLLLTTENPNYEELEKEVLAYMKKVYKVSSGSVTIMTPLELGIIEL